MKQVYMQLGIKHYFLIYLEEVCSNKPQQPLLSSSGKHHKKSLFQYSTFAKFNTVLYAAPLSPNKDGDKFPLISSLISSSYYTKQNNNNHHK